MPDDDAPPVAAAPMLTCGYVTFGSLNKVVKISESCARAWARLLDAVPGSRLLLPVPGGELDGDARQIVLERLARWGLASNRIDVCGKTATRREYLERFAEIDVALDTWPFNGITTTCDGLWMGVPAVSLAGNTSVSRAGGSILRAANLETLATTTVDAFVDAAVELVHDYNAIAESRIRLRERLQHSALMDPRGFTARLERAFGEMMQD